MSVSKVFTFYGLIFVYVFPYFLKNTYFQFFISLSTKFYVEKPAGEVERSLSGPLVSSILNFTRVCLPSRSEWRIGAHQFPYDGEQCWANIGPSPWAHNCIYWKFGMARLQCHVFNQNICFVFMVT
jgi:hypothetical protein